MRFLLVLSLFFVGCGGKMSSEMSGDSEQVAQSPLEYSLMGSPALAKVTKGGEAKAANKSRIDLPSSSLRKIIYTAEIRC